MLAVSLLYAGIVKAQTWAEVEVMSRNDRTNTLDTKVGGDLGKRFGFVGRNRLTITQNDVNSFSFVDINYPIKFGVRGVMETQAVEGTGLKYMPGIDYFKDFGVGSFYTIAMRSLNTQDNEVITLTQWNPRVGNVDLVTQLETSTNFGRNYNFQVVRSRIGVVYKGHKVGVGLDVSNVNGMKTDKMYGGFWSKKF